MKNTIVIVIGGDHYNTYGIIRSLGKKGIISDILILGKKRNESFVLKSKYVRNGYGCQSYEQAIGYLINNYDNTTNNIVICCSDEAEEFIINQYDELLNKFILPICKNPQETKRLMNKSAIGALAQSCGIRIPETWEVVGRIIPKDVEFPCLTKPRESTKGRKSDIVVCHNEEELTAVINDPNRCSDYVVQEYVEYEKEISILGAVLQNGEIIFSGCIDKLRTCMIGTSSFAVMIDNSVLGDNVAKLKELMEKSGYKGLFSAEFLKKDDQYYFLEVNFRNDGNTYVATTSGQNLPYLYVMSCINGSMPKGIFAHYPCYFMLEIEDFIARRKNGVSFRQWKKDLQKADCCLVYDKNDRAPFRKKIWLIIGSYFRIVFLKVGLIKMNMSVIKKIKQYGVKGIFRFIGTRIFHTNWHKAHYLRLNIDIDKTNELLKGFDLDVKELTYDDFLKGDQNVFKGEKLELYKQRCQDPTYKAYGIMENNRLVYSTWVSYHRLGMSVETKPVYLTINEGYLEDSYCDPIARGRGLHSKMNNFRIKKIYEAGKDRVIAIVQEGNTPAFKVQFKSGFEEIGTFYHGYIFGIKFNTLKKEKFDGK